MSRHIAGKTWNMKQKALDAFMPFYSIISIANHWGFHYDIYGSFKQKWIKKMEEVKRIEWKRERERDLYIIEKGCWIFEVDWWQSRSTNADDDNDDESEEKMRSNRVNERN